MEQAQLIDANPDYSRVKYNDGRGIFTCYSVLIILYTHFEVGSLWYVKTFCFVYYITEYSAVHELKLIIVYENPMKKDVFCVCSRVLE